MNARIRTHSPLRTSSEEWYPQGLAAGPLQRGSLMSRPFLPAVSLDAWTQRVRLWGLGELEWPIPGRPPPTKAAECVELQLLLH